MLTLDEVLERLKTFDELTLLEMLDLTSEELVQDYAEQIEENFEFYHEQVKETADSSA